jgi:hypothetical protein
MWDEKHPKGVLDQTIGQVDVLDNFYEYQLYCKSLNASIQHFQKETVKALENVSHENFIESILKKYPSEEKMKTVYDRLRSYGHKLIIIKLDSSNYELAIPFKTPLSDTLRAKDSLKEFFGGSPYVKF